MMRIILYTGKGGVGKTSVAAATACKIANSGRKVLIMSTDQAHSLGDSFEMTLNNQPQHVMENLDALEISAMEECERVWGNLKDYMKRLLTLKSGESIEVEELLVFPGFEELCSLLRIKEIYDQNEYDVLVVDCAPTGETLSLLKYPEMFGDWVNQIIPFKRKAVKIAGPAVEKVTKIPMPKEDVFSEIEGLCDKLRALKELMMKKDVVSLRIVTTPEKIVIQEAKRNYAYLHLFDYNVDAIIVNKIYPEQSMKGYFKKWAENQKKALADIQASFYKVPIFSLELRKTELRGVTQLLEVADLLYQDERPEQIFVTEKIFEEKAEDDCRQFILHVPFQRIEDMDLYQKGEELHLTIQNEHRKFMLSDDFKNKEIHGAKYREGCLIISFQ
ncbi:arsenical pump-driving ATPase [Lachnospiraceae bacterium KM106-2]|nr:arsenical pump-driving ATPase [Lachnospiraceae bacterium KM106-2]